MQPYAQPSKGTTSAGKNFISTLMTKIPFSYQIIDNITQLNPKFEVFNDIVKDREQRLANQSVYRGEVIDDTGYGSLLVNKNYHQFMYAGTDFDKVKRLQEYRRMSSYSELNECIEEICDEVLYKDDNDEYLSMKITEAAGYSKIIKEEIQKEWEKFISIFELDEKGWGYFRDFVVDGELFWENLISTNNPEYGILGLVRIPTELINAVYNNVQNDMLENFLLRRPVVNPKTNVVDREELVIFDKSQVTYIHSNLWSEDKSMKLPYIERAKRAYKLLSLVEDSIIIHRMRMAPERLVFNVDVGNMSTPKAEAYLKRLMQQYWTKKTFDSTTGRIINIYDPQSYNDSYFFAKRTGTEGTTVTNMEGKSNLGQLDDLYYYIKKLYRAMKVPVGRLNPEEVVKDGTDATVENLRFAKFLMNIQKRFADGIKKSFIVHLKLRNMWRLYKIKERYINVVFNLPTIYMAMKNQQYLDIKINNFNNLSQNEGVSNSFAQVKYLGWTEEELAINREWRRKDAAFQYELEQILQAGINWKQQQNALNSAAQEIAGGGGGGGAPAGGAGGGQSELPEFGPAPGGGEQGAEGAAPAPAGGAAPAAPAAGGAPAAPAPAPTK